MEHTLIIFDYRGTLYKQGRIVHGMDEVIKEALVFPKKMSQSTHIPYKQFSSLKKTKTEIDLRTK